MKKLYLILSLACMSVAAYSQKMEKPEVDQISGETTLRTSHETVYKNITFSGTLQELTTYGFKKQDVQAIFFEIEFNVGHAEDFFIRKGDKVQMKLADNTIVTLAAAFDGTSVTNKKAVGRSVTTRLLMSYLLTPEDVKKLSDSNVKFIRFQNSDTNIDYELKEKNYQVIGKVVKMIADAKA